MNINNCTLNADELLPDVAKLVTVAGDELYAVLDDVSTEKAAQRLMIALADRDGVSVETVSKQYAIPRSTIYYRLDRVEALPIEEAIADDVSPGCPPSLTADQREPLQAGLAQSLRAVRIDAEAWLTETNRGHIEGQSGVATITATFGPSGERSRPCPPAGGRPWRRGK